MKKVLKWLPALVAMGVLCLPANAAANLLDCINTVEANFNICAEQALAAGIIGAGVGGFVGMLGGLVGVGIGASAGFLTGAGPRAYACADNYIRESDHCYATYPLMN